MSELRLKSTGTIKLFENDNTSNITIASPASLGADRTITLPDASVTLASGTMLATDGSGASLTALNASELGSGTVPTARLGSGTASSSVFLAGDNTWAAAGSDNTPRFRVRKTSDQSISDGVITQVTWDAEDYDTDSAFASEKFTVPAGEGGTYHLYGQFKYSSSAQNDVMGASISLYKNGAVLQSNSFLAGGYISGTEVPYLGGWLTVAATVVLVATDYMEIFAFINTLSGTPSVQEGDGKGAIFEGFKIG
jgi:hypothetical protein